MCVVRRARSSTELSFSLCCAVLLFYFLVFRVGGRSYSAGDSNRVLLGAFVEVQGCIMIALRFRWIFYFYAHLQYFIVYLYIYRVCYSRFNLLAFPIAKSLSSPSRGRATCELFPPCASTQPLSAIPCHGDPSLR